MTESIVVARPAGPAGLLFLLFHGVGGRPSDLEPLGRHLAREFPAAAVVSVAGRRTSGEGPGREWFAVAGIGEANRAGRVDEAMPEFLAAVRHWQAAFGVGVEATALVGFSQGAIMALESTRGRESPAARVVAIAGRYALLPEAAPPTTTVHLFHGKDDAVIAYGHAVAAAERLVALGGDVTADVLPFVGHEVNDEIAALLVERLKGYLPRRKWEEAMREAEAALPPRPVSRS